MKIMDITNLTAWFFENKRNTRKASFRDDRLYASYMLP